MIDRLMKFHLVYFSMIALCDVLCQHSNGLPPDDHRPGLESHVCYTAFGVEPNYHDADCKTYFFCNDYWGTKHHCPPATQFNFEEGECMSDGEVWCQWQLQHYGTIGSRGIDNSGSSNEKRCEAAFGLEPNFQDSECKSYFDCQNHRAVLNYCPGGYQFHMEQRECRKDADVLCQWQLEEYGKSHETSPSSGSSESSPLGSLGSSGHGDGHPLKAALSPYHNSDKSEGHICKVANGFEANYDDSEECGSYYKCDDYWGSLRSCKWPDQWHFQYHMCMNDDDVSCWVQMEKYYHGHKYDGAESTNESESNTKICDKAKGQEPNYLDEGCKSYWYCEDYSGTLYECPTGFQFDWNKLDCGRDADVICEKQMEYYYEHIYYRQVHGPDDPFVRPDTSEGQKGDSQQVSLSRKTDRAPHRCDVEYGREADYESKDCQGYWKCSGFQGNYEICPHGYQFHWHERECLKSEYVNCLKQRDSYTGTSRSSQRRRNEKQGRDE